MESLEAQHRSGDALDEAVVFLKNIIQLFELRDFVEGLCPRVLQDHVQCLQTSQIDVTLVDAPPDLARRSYWLPV